MRFADARYAALSGSPADALIGRRAWGVDEMERAERRGAAVVLPNGRIRFESTVRRVAAEPGEQPVLVDLTPLRSRRGDLEFYVAYACALGAPAAIDASPDSRSVLLLDDRLVVQHASAEACRVLERDVDQLIGVGLGSAFDSADRGRIADFGNRLASGEAVTLPRLRLAGDGAILELSGERLPSPSRGAGIVAFLRATVEPQSGPTRVGEGRLPSIELAAVAALARRAAHDLNNQLTAIYGAASELRARLGPDEAGASELDSIEQAADVAAIVTRSLVAFGPQTPAQHKPVDLAALLREVAQVLRNVLPATVDVRLADDLPVSLWSRGNAAQLHHAAINLAVAARDSLPVGAWLELDLDPGAPAGGEDLVGLTLTYPSEAPSVALAESLMARDAPSESAPWLAFVRQIVADHGGGLSVDCGPDQVVRITVHLPREPAPVQRGASSDAAAAPAAVGEGVVAIVAEDNDAVCGLVVRELRKLGFAVVELRDGAGVVDAFVRRRESVGLLVLDVDLPYRSGLQCAETIRATEGGGEVPVLFITGNPDPRLEERIDEHAMLLRKPFRMAEFIAAVRKLSGRQRQYPRGSPSSGTRGS